MARDRSPVGVVMAELELNYIAQHIRRMYVAFRDGVGVCVCACVGGGCFVSLYAGMVGGFIAVCVGQTEQGDNAFIVQRRRLRWI